MKTVFTILVICSFVYSAFAQPGTLDKTFGEEGKLLSTTSTGLPFPAYSVIEKKDRDILVGSGEATGFLLKQFLSNGTLDSSFGIAGEAKTTFKNYLYANVNALSIVEGNKIVAAGNGIGGAGSHNNDVLLARYLDNGAADSSFGINGKVVGDFKLIEVVNCMKITSQGKILVAGYCANGDEGKETCFLAQFNSNGSVDTNFGDSGKVVTDVDSFYQSYINSIAITVDGSIIAAGSAKYIPNPKQDQILLIKYSVDGKISTDFGAKGLVFTNVGSDADYAYAVALQNDGKIVVAGVANYKIQDSSAMAIVRYNSDGSLDKSFNNTGSLSVFFGIDNAVAKALIIQSNGSFLLGGGKGPDYSSPYNYAAEDFALAAITKNGKVDSSFGTNGLVTLDFDKTQDECNALALQADGKIIAAGGSTDISTQKPYIAIARFNDLKSKKQIIISKTKHYISTHNNANAATLSYNITLYPNPVQNILTIKGLSSSNNYHLIINNSKGGVVATKQVNNISSYQFNVQNLSSGVYYVNIVANNKVVTTLKFVKE